jgi:oligopeptide transport system substrate-binding protein
MNRRILTLTIILTLCALVLVPAQSYAKQGWPGRGTNSPLLVDPDHVLALSLVADPVLDPALASAGEDFFVLNQILVGLFRLEEETGDLTPELATSWTMSPDAQAFSFTLRGDAHWTNGAPVTAFDVRNGILHALEPSTDAPQSYVLHVIHNAYEFEEGSVTDPNLVGVLAPDSTHLVFHLNWPAAYLPSILSLPVARPIPPGTPNWTDPSSMITNGPYRVSSWSSWTSLTLMKNALFYGAAGVPIEQVDIGITDEGTAWTAYQGDLLDSVTVPQSEWAAAQADPLLAPQLVVSPTPCTYYYGFNTAKAPSTTHWCARPSSPRWTGRTSSTQSWATFSSPLSPTRPPEFTDTWTAWPKALASRSMCPRPRRISPMPAIPEELVCRQSRWHSTPARCINPSQTTHDKTGLTTWV